MRSGLIGKGEPVYTYTEVAGGKKQIETCAVTVKRLVSGHIGEYTAKVFFSEYSTGKNLWVSKPHTMIAKVAEMHALRMAFPEEMAKQYVEEEMVRATVVEMPTGISDDDREKAIASLNEAKTLDALQDAWVALTQKQREDEGVRAVVERLKENLQKPVTPEVEIVPPVKAEEGEAPLDTIDFGEGSAPVDITSTKKKK